MIELAGVAWTVGLCAIGCVIWFIRLESRLIYLEKDHDKLVELSAKNDLAFDKKIDKLGNDLNEIRVILARIEGSLKQTHDV